MTDNELSGHFIHTGPEPEDRHELTWRELAEQRHEEILRLQGFAGLVADLDRNATGRHEGDADVYDPTGTSQGNPLIRPGVIFAYSIGGASRPYAVPASGPRSSVEDYLRAGAEALPMPDLAAIATGLQVQYRLCVTGIAQWGIFDPDRAMFAPFTAELIADLARMDLESGAKHPDSFEWFAIALYPTIEEAGR